MPKAIMRGVQYGFSSATFDFDYITTIRDDEGKEHRVYGGRLAYMILGWFMDREFIDYGYGYKERLNMINDLERAIYGERS
jgi:hypothetical protein